MGTEKYTPESITVGKLVKKLKEAYPDLSGSKLRFLESEGLISPKRAANKYRVFYKEDIEKINFILKMQKEFYLPLNVIKEKLKSKEYRDFSLEGKGIKSLQLKLGEDFDPGNQQKVYGVDDIKKKFKVNDSFINDLVDHGVIDWKMEDGRYLIDGENMEIIKTAKGLSKYGIQVKHLKLFENFSSRHSSFIQQIILPLLMSSHKDTRKKAFLMMKKLERELCDFHELLLKKENKKFLEKYK
ncbi:MAG: MerR family transcriptional regulator [Actinobacteria bacterium]|nr:MerR family transcriptional regulator [Actinomycetota bacterium]